MKVTVISGSPRRVANTLTVMKFVYEYAKTKCDNVKFVDLAKGEIEYYRGDVEYNEATKQAVKDIIESDVWLIGSPIYNSFFSAALKNLFEFVDYKKTSGKVAGLTIVASGNIGFIDVQTLLTQLMSYFRVITNPKAVYITVDLIKDGKIDPSAQERLKKMVDETIELSFR